MQDFLFFSFVNICIVVGDPIIKRESIGIQITCLIPPHFCSYPIADLNFQSQISRSFSVQCIF